MKRKKKPRVVIKYVKRAGKDLAVPVLSAPVGVETPALKAKYPNMNAAADLEIVDYYLSTLEAARSLGPGAGVSELATSRLFGVVAKNIDWNDRNAAIEGLQQQLSREIDAEELSNRLIKPNGKTLMALVDLGDLAEKLLGDESSSAHAKFIHTGAFEHGMFSRLYKAEFGRECPEAMFVLLGFMERDSYMIDVRWIAYMLATTYKESKFTMEPTDEVGKGNLGISRETGLDRGRLEYYQPVKLKRLPDGNVRVTEWDGGQFQVRADGYVPPIAKGQRGAVADLPAAAVYTRDDGTEQRFFGRGYVQITWWNSYANAGRVLGKGVQLLLNPELVKHAPTAYSIMSMGMRTGQIFANGRSLGQFIIGGHCDYVGARKMVNSTGGEEIAEFARKFERILLAAKTPMIASNSNAGRSMERQV